MQFIYTVNDKIINVNNTVTIEYEYSNINECYVICACNSNHLIIADICYANTETDARNIMLKIMLDLTTHKNIIITDDYIKNIVG